MDRLYFLKKLEKYAGKYEKAKVFVYVMLWEIIILVMEKLTIFLAIRGFHELWIEEW